MGTLSRCFLLLREPLRQALVHELRPQDIKRRILHALIKVLRATYALVGAALAFSTLGQKHLLPLVSFFSLLVARPLKEAVGSNALVVEVKVCVQSSSTYAALFNVVLVQYRHDRAGRLFDFTACPEIVE